MDITDAAKAEPSRLRALRVHDNARCLRLVTPPQWAGDGDFGIGIDEVQDSDYVVEVDEVQVLLVDWDLASRLANAVLDFKTVSGVSGFSLDIY